MMDVSITLKNKLKSNNKANLTLSIDNSLLEEIKKEAERNGTSINSRVNAILTKYVKFYKMTEELESSVIPAKIWISMLDLMDENGLKDVLNNEGVGTIYSIFLNNNVSMTLDNFVKYCCQEICLWAGMYSSFRNFKENGHVTLVFEHKFGVKWSRVLGETFSNFIRIMLSRPTEFEILPNTVRIKVKE